MCITRLHNFCINECCALEINADEVQDNGPGFIPSDISVTSIEGNSMLWAIKLRLGLQMILELLPKTVDYWLLFWCQVQPNQPHSQVVQILQQTEKDVYQPRRAVVLLYSYKIEIGIIFEPAVFFLGLGIAISSWIIASFDAFFTPLIFSQLHTVRRSLCLSVLLSNSQMAYFNYYQVSPSMVFK